jgi:hypothetical protein
MQKSTQVRAFHVVPAEARDIFRVGSAGQWVPSKLPYARFVSQNLDGPCFKETDGDFLQLIQAEHGDGMLKRGSRSPRHIGERVGYAQKMCSQSGSRGIGPTGGPGGS